jgi:hypothetical protein
MPKHFEAQTDFSQTGASTLKDGGHFLTLSRAYWVCQEIAFKGGHSREVIGSFTFAVWVSAYKLIVAGGAAVEREQIKAGYRLGIAIAILANHPLPVVTSCTFLLKCR